MNDQRYNGYTNYETWCFMLHVDNTPGDQAYWIEQAVDRLTFHEGDEGAATNDLSETISDHIWNELEEHRPIASGFLLDILTQGVQAIDTHECAALMVRDAIDTGEYAPEPDEDEEE